MKYFIQDCELNITVDGNIYNEEVLFKCFYWYGKHFNVQIASCNESEYIIKIKFKEFAPKQETWEEVVSKVERDLIDFKLRDIVTKETKDVRELIIAKAFAYYEPDQSPISEVSDPVGFSPEIINLYA